MKKIINTQNTMSYSEFLRRVADAIDKSAPKNVKDMNALVSSVTKSMERSEREKERVTVSLLANLLFSRMNLIHIL